MTAVKVTAARLRKRSEIKLTSLENAKSFGGRDQNFSADCQITRTIVIAINNLTLKFPRPIARQKNTRPDRAAKKRKIQTNTRVFNLQTLVATVRGSCEKKFHQNVRR